MDILFFKAALFGYLLSTCGYMASLILKRVSAARISAWVLLAAFVLHTVSLGLRAGGAGLTPAVNLHEALSFFSWAISGGYLAFQLKTRTRVLGAFVSPAALILMLAAASGLDVISIPESLEGGLVAAHVILSLTGEALLGLACLAGIAYLLQDRWLKNRRVTGYSRLLPPLGDLDRIGHICLLIGFPLLTFGIAAGSIWAGSVWGSHWSWDSKQILTSLAWLAYAVLLHQRLAIGWTGRKAAVLSIAAFLFVLFTLIGNAFFRSVHNFV
ncbi:MAG: cytochrome c biogenesis protein CcsA [Syntrophales bacterium]|nr:cytochrome c biogenesis protein CcsA [Syntrophales bacterium]MDD5232064.1 cytochrome c biogenesis protein CcsA [Syntrophales bacterium]